MVVLCYHRVNDIHDDWNNITVTQNTFIKQLQYLRQNYDIVYSCNDIYKEHAVAITFDDGYEDTYLNAFPILKQLNIPATLFISTLCIDQENEDWCNELSRLIIEGGKGKTHLQFRGETYPVSTLEERKNTNRQIFRIIKSDDIDVRNDSMMEIGKWSGQEGAKPRLAFRMLRSLQIQELATSNLIRIGAHTVTHPSLSTLSESSQESELINSKNKLEEITGKIITEFAYPFGYPRDYSEKTITLLKKVGFERAFITHHFERHSDDAKYEIRRLCISECPIEEFAEMIHSEILLNQR